MLGANKSGGNNANTQSSSGINTNPLMEHLLKNAGSNPHGSKEPSSYYNDDANHSRSSYHAQENNNTYNSQMSGYPYGDFPIQHTKSFQQEQKNKRQIRASRDNANYQPPNSSAPSTAVSTLNHFNQPLYPGQEPAQMQSSSHRASGHINESWSNKHTNNFNTANNNWDSPYGWNNPNYNYHNSHNSHNNDHQRSSSHNHHGDNHNKEHGPNSHNGGQHHSHENKHGHNHKSGGLDMNALLPLLSGGKGGANPMLSQLLPMISGNKKNMNANDLMKFFAGNGNKKTGKLDTEVLSDDTIIIDNLKRVDENS